MTFAQFYYSIENDTTLNYESNTTLGTMTKIQ